MDADIIIRHRKIFRLISLGFFFLSYLMFANHPEKQWLDDEKGNITYYADHYIRVVVLVAIMFFSLIFLLPFKITRRRITFIKYDFIFSLAILITPLLLLIASIIFMSIGVKQHNNDISLRTTMLPIAIALTISCIIFSLSIPLLIVKFFILRNKNNSLKEIYSTLILALITIYSLLFYFKLAEVFTIPYLQLAKTFPLYINPMTICAFSALYLITLWVVDIVKTSFHYFIK